LHDANHPPPLIVVPAVLGWLSVEVGEWDLAPTLDAALEALLDV
jgi:hypothetical protein